MLHHTNQVETSAEEAIEANVMEFDAEGVKSSGGGEHGRREGSLLSRSEDCKDDNGEYIMNGYMI